MATQILEGTWEEIVAHADELSGKHLRVIYEADAERPNVGPPNVGPPNEKMLSVLREIEELQRGMPPTFGDSVAEVRYGRSGPMYGMEPRED